MTKKKVPEKKVEKKAEKKVEKKAEKKPEKKAEKRSHHKKTKISEIEVVIAEKPEPKPEPPKMPKKDELKAAEDLVSEVRVAYGNFRSSWFEFARAITIVHDSDAWNKLGHPSFKDYCLEEFTDMNYSTIVKFIGVMHGQIGRLLGSKVDKDPAASLPAWETCYQVQVAEKRLPEKEMPKLYKEVLDCNATLATIKEKIRKVGFKHEILKEKKETLKDEDVFNTDDGDEVVDVEGEVIVDEIDEQAAFLIDVAKRLKKGLEALTEQVTSGTDKTVMLAEILYEKLIPIANAYIDKVEDITSDEGE